MWQSAADEYIGAPLVFDNSLIIAQQHGAVRRLDFSGAVRETWTVPGSDSKDTPVNFAFGPSAGGGALWLLDETGAIWRLGPPLRETKEAFPPVTPGSTTLPGSIDSSTGFSQPLGLERQIER